MTYLKNVKLCILWNFRNRVIYNSFREYVREIFAAILEVIQDTLAVIVNLLFVVCYLLVIAFLPLWLLAQSFYYPVAKPDIMYDLRRLRAKSQQKKLDAQLIRA